MSRVCTEVKKILLGLFVAFSILLLNDVGTKEVHAAIEFSRDQLMITEGEMVYLPHYISGGLYSKSVNYYWDEEDIENPVVILIGSETDPNQLWIGGNKPGSVNIYIEDSYGAMDVITVTVIDAIEADWISGTAEFGFYPGHVIKSYY